MKKTIKTHFTREELASLFETSPATVFNICTEYDIPYERGKHKTRLYLLIAFDAVWQVLQKKDSLIKALAQERLAETMLKFKVENRLKKINDILNE